MATTPKNCGYPVGTLDGKRFVGYKIIRVDRFSSALCGLYQKAYDYPKSFLEGYTLLNPGKPQLCVNGWHAWRTLWTTRHEVKLCYWGGRVLPSGCRYRLFAVEIWGDVEIRKDKFVGSHMRVLYEIPINWDANRLLPSRTFTRAWNRYLAKRKENK